MNRYNYMDTYLSYEMAQSKMPTDAGFAAG